MSAKPSVSLVHQVLARVLPPALIALFLLGAIFVHREKRSMTERVVERLEQGLERGSAMFREKIASIQGQTRMIAQNDLIANGLIDTQERMQYLPVYFRSQGSVAGTAAEGRFSLLDFRGREILSNPITGGPMVNEDDHATAIAQGDEILQFDEQGLLFASPVLIHGFAEGFVSISISPRSVQTFFVDSAPTGYAIAIYNGQGDLLLANSYHLEALGPQVDARHADDWTTIQTTLGPDGKGGTLEMQIGLARSVGYADLAQAFRQMLFLLAMALLIILGAIVVATRLTARPVVQLSQELQAIAQEENLGQRVPVQGPRELQALANAFNKTMSALERSHTSLTHLDEMMSGSPTVIYTLCPTNFHFTFLSANVQNLLGFDRQAPLQDPEWWQLRLHPEDRQGWQIKLNAWLTTGNQAHMVMDYRMRRQDGAWLWIEDRLQAFRHPNGQVREWIGSLTDISQRKHAEAALATEVAERRILLDNINTQVWYLVDEQTYGTVNRAHADFNGLPPEALAYRSMYDIYPPDVANLCKKGNIAVFTTGQPVRTEEWVPHASGERRLLSILKSPKTRDDGTVEYVVCSAEDITDRKRAENQLIHHMRIEKMIATISTWFINVDLVETDNLIQQALQAMGDMIGVDRIFVFLYSPDYKTCSNTIEWCARYITPQKDNLQQIPCASIAWWTRKILAQQNIIISDISDMPAEASAERQMLEKQDIQSVLIVPLSWGGQVEGFMGFDAVQTRRVWTAEDIAQLELLAGIVHNAIKHQGFVDQLNQMNAKLEERVEQRTRALNEAQAKIYLQDKMASVGQLAAGLAHEINNPINFVAINFAALEEDMQVFQAILTEYQTFVQSCDGWDDEKTRQLSRLRRRETELELPFVLRDMPSLFTESREGLRRITEIINSMRNFARQDRMHTWIDLDLNSAVRDTLSLARNAYKYSTDVELNLQEIPTVSCVAGLINQVLLNLIINAAQAVEAMVTNDDAKGIIRIRTGIDLEGVFCEVQDNGPGIPETVHERIFDPFFTTKEPGKGTGLGLSISYDIIVNQHNGNLTFHTQPGKGACFRFTLPKCGKR